MVKGKIEYLKLKGKEVYSTVSKFGGKMVGYKDNMVVVLIEGNNPLAWKCLSNDDKELFILKKYKVKDNKFLYIHADLID